MAENTALFAPMASASVNITVAVNAGVFARPRRAYLTFRTLDSSQS